MLSPPAHFGAGFRASRQGVLAFTTTADGRLLPPPQATYLPLTVKQHR